MIAATLLRFSNEQTRRIKNFFLVAMTESWMCLASRRSQLGFDSVRGSFDPPRRSIVSGARRLETAAEADGNLLRILQSLEMCQDRRKKGGGGVNKFKGRLADIMSICHLAPRAIKGLCEWSLLLGESAACHC